MNWLINFVTPENRDLYPELFIVEYNCDQWLEDASDMGDIIASTLTKSGLAYASPHLM